MDAKHTEGPWSVDQIDIDEAHILGASNGFCADIIGTIHTSNKIEVANAHLIAAAPELLEALQALLAWDGEGSQWANVETPADLARVAIAKATSQ